MKATRYRLLSTIELEMEVYTLRKPTTFCICLKVIVTVFVHVISFLQLSSAQSSPQSPRKFRQNHHLPLALLQNPHSLHLINKNYQTMCYAALLSTIKAARGDTYAMVARLAKEKGLSKFEAAAITDCIENIQESVKKVQQTLRVVANVRGADRQFQLWNAKTCASAATTDPMHLPCHFMKRSGLVSWLDSLGLVL